MTELKELYWHNCEACGKKELLTLEDGFNQGWDYPPRIGVWGVLSPRTCGDCGIEKTLYWQILTEPEKPLTVEQQRFARRVAAETGIPDVVEEIQSPETT